MAWGLRLYMHKGMNLTMSHPLLRRRYQWNVLPFDLPYSEVCSRCGAGALASLGPLAWAGLQGDAVSPTGLLSHQLIRDKPTTTAHVHLQPQIGMQRDLDHTLKDIPDCVSRIDRIVLASPDPGSHTQHVSGACPVTAPHAQAPWACMQQAGAIHAAI